MEHIDIRHRAKRKRRSQALPQKQAALNEWFVALPPKFWTRQIKTKVYSGAAVFLPLISIVPLIAAANDANATSQMFVAYVALVAPAKSVGYPPHLFCCVASV